MLSGTAEYALRAVINLALRDAGEPVAVRALARELEMPQNYLSKIFYELAREGVLTSTRGKGGGFRLARPASRITLLSVVRPFGFESSPRRCFLGRENCSDLNPCPVHDRWKPISESITGFLKRTTVADVIAR